MPIRTPTYFTAITRFHRFSPGSICLTEKLFTKIENPSIKNLCKVMMMADIFARRAPMCDLEREVVGTIARSPRQGQSRVTLHSSRRFLGAASPICAGGELSAYWHGGAN